VIGTRGRCTDAVNPRGPSGIVGERRQGADRRLPSGARRFCQRVGGGGLSLVAKRIAWPRRRGAWHEARIDLFVMAPIARNADKHFFFLDYMQWSWAWTISCANDETFGHVALIGGHSEAYVATSFTDLVERYTNDRFHVSRPARTKRKIGRFWDWLLRR
jgi:hypothetical protein